MRRLIVAAALAAAPVAHAAPKETQKQIETFDAAALAIVDAVAASLDCADVVIQPDVAPILSKTIEALGIVEGGRRERFMSKGAAAFAKRKQDLGAAACKITVLMYPKLIRHK